MTKLATAQAASADISLAGKHAVVVGGTSGIGHGLALRLAQAGCSVTIVGRSAERGSKIVASLAKAEGAKHSFEPLDAFSLKACDALAAKMSAKSLDLLVLTQGMATIQKHTPVPETGLDEKLSLHVYSRVALAKALAPALEKASDPRVLSVLSAGIHGPFKAYKESPELLKGYSVPKAADAGGFYTDIALESLAAAHPKVSFLHAAPGFVNTNWGTEMPTVLRWLIRGLQPLGRSKEACGEFMFKGLVMPEFRGGEGGGGFHLLDQYGEPGPTTCAMHDVAKADVWAHLQAVLAKGGSVEGK